LRGGRPAGQDGSTSPVRKIYALCGKIAEFRFKVRKAGRTALEFGYISRHSGSRTTRNFMRLGIKYKLFFALLSAHILVLLAMYAIVNYNFDRGFREYVSRIEERQVPALVAGLAEYYRKTGTWELLPANYQIWSDLIAVSISSSADDDLRERMRVNRPVPGFTQNDWYYTSEYSPARPYLHLLDAE